jgi:hypothetical protein
VPLSRLLKIAGRRDRLHQLLGRTSRWNEANLSSISPPCS